MRIGFWLCILIAVAVVIRRLLALAYPPQSAPPQMAGLDTAFASHAALTLAHILPALAFVLLLALSYFPRFANAGWLMHLLFPLGAIVGITAYTMSIYSVGGWIERSAVLFFNSLFLYSLVRAWLFMKSGDQGLQQQWMTRAVAILLGIATTRPVMGVFFATSSLTHLTPKQFFGIAFWIGFSINTIVIELWLRSKKNPFPLERMASHPAK
jgi:uncharacterized membrane protein YsdA (DUF1294 family)